MSAFFLPGVPPEMAAETYQALAAMCGAKPQPPSRRIRLIEFTHDGTYWTAEVGELRLGRTPRRTRSGHEDYTKPAVRSTSGRRIAAIFAGPPCYLVLEDIGAPGPRTWANPALCGEATRVEYFDAPDDQTAP